MMVQTCVTMTWWVISARPYLWELRGRLDTELNLLKREAGW